MLDSQSSGKIVVLVSSDTEWEVVRGQYTDARVETSPFGEWFETSFAGATSPIVLFHGGWGKVAAAASTQYVIDCLKPELLIHIGTCGGLDPALKRGDVILAEKTLIYDIVEQMGDADTAIAAYTTVVDTSWVRTLPSGTQRGLVVSADRDVLQTEVTTLRRNHQAVVADWESGAVAWVAARNSTPILILRGVSDMVSEHDAQAYENASYFADGARVVIISILSQLPGYVSQWNAK